MYKWGAWSSCHPVPRCHCASPTFVEPPVAQTDTVHSHHSEGSSALGAVCKGRVGGNAGSSLWIRDMWGAVLNSESKQGEDGRMKGVACGEKKHMGASGRACQGACAAASCLLPISTCSILACWSLLSSACAKINDMKPKASVALQPKSAGRSSSTATTLESLGIPQRQPSQRESCGGRQRTETMTAILQENKTKDYSNRQQP
jgi:hypothetical protein